MPPDWRDERIKQGLDSVVTSDVPGLRKHAEKLTRLVDSIQAKLPMDPPSLQISVEFPDQAIAQVEAGVREAATEAANAAQQAADLGWRQAETQEAGNQLLDQAVWRLKGIEWGVTELAFDLPYQLGELIDIGRDQLDHQRMALGLQGLTMLAHARSLRRVEEAVVEQGDRVASAVEDMGERLSVSTEEFAAALVHELRTGFGGLIEAQNRTVVGAYMASTQLNAALGELLDATLDIRANTGVIAEAVVRPERARAVEQLGQANQHRTVGRKKAALKCVLTALRHDGAFPQGWYALGRIALLDLADYARARKAFFLAWDYARAGNDWESRGSAAGQLAALSSALGDGETASRILCDEMAASPAPSPRLSALWLLHATPTGLKRCCSEPVFLRRAVGAMVRSPACLIDGTTSQRARELLCKWSDWVPDSAEEPGEAKACDAVAGRLNRAQEAAARLLERLVERWSRVNSASSAPIAPLHECWLDQFEDEYDASVQASSDPNRLAEPWRCVPGLRGHMAGAGHPRTHFSDTIEYVSALEQFIRLQLVPGWIGMRFWAAATRSWAGTQRHTPERAARFDFIESAQEVYDAARVLIELVGGDSWGKMCQLLEQAGRMSSSNLANACRSWLKEETWEAVVRVLLTSRMSTHPPLLLLSRFSTPWAIDEAPLAQADRGAPAGRSAT